MASINKDLLSCQNLRGNIYLVHKTTSRILLQTIYLADHQVEELLDVVLFYALLERNGIGRVNRAHNSGPQFLQSCSVAARKHGRCNRDCCPEGMTLSSQHPLGEDNIFACIG